MRGLAFMLLALAPFPALALEDSASGLKLELPADYAIHTDAPQDKAFAVMIGISRPSGDLQPVTGDQYICQLGFQALPSPLDQPAINTETAKSLPWPARAASTMEKLYALDTAVDFAINGIAGRRFQMRLLYGPPEAQTSRILQSVVSTPKGRTVLNCVVSLDQLDQAIPIIDAIWNGVTPP